jgi:tRNA pseudouridine38-40 synthase
MRSLRITLAYDGGSFAGWQFQPNQRTVQGVVEDAIFQITQERVRVQGSGRTDAGVHALGQVASVELNNGLPAERLCLALNSVLPDDVSLIDVSDAPPRFHACRDAIKKRYRYQIDNGKRANVFLRRYRWHHGQTLDVKLMHEASQSLVGRHDFRSFETAGSERTDTVRTVSDMVVHRDERDGSQVNVEVEADGFLYNMVRTIVGTLCWVGHGRKPPSWVGDVLGALDRRKAGTTAPPHGLFLVHVYYPREVLEFQPPENASGS